MYNDRPYDVLVVGAGLSGAVIAERYANVLGKRVLVIDKREHIAGNCYDYWCNGILVSKYGAHIFHTSNDNVWRYVNQFTQFNNYRHRVLSAIDGKLVPFPVCIQTLNRLFDAKITSGEMMQEWLLKEPGVGTKIKIKNAEDFVINRVGVRLYELFFKYYTLKQWGIGAKEIGKEVTQRIPVRFSNDAFYFSDKYEGMPVNGYTNMIDRMLSSDNISIKLGIDYIKNKDRYTNFQKVYYTGPIDDYFNYIHGKLGYRSLFFENNLIKKKYHQKVAVINYPQGNVPYTRIIEHKHFYDNLNERETVVSIEHSSDVGDPYYPILNDKNKEIFDKYKALIKEEEEKNIFFVGRLANYKYFNMDQAIKNALDLFNKIEYEKSCNEKL